MNDRGWSGRLEDLVHVTDYVANGSFASLKENVVYSDSPTYAVLVRTVDYNRGWSGEYVWVDKRAYDFLDKSSLVPGDLVISNVGSVGTAFRVPDLGVPMTLGPNAVLCRTRNPRQLDQRFLYYYFTSRIGQDAIRSIVSGSVQSKFNKGSLRALRVHFPPISDQQTIASALGALDDKIELNRRMSENIFETIRAVFKAWFVEFSAGPAKGQVLKELTNGRILPENWDLIPLANFADVVYGAPFASSEFTVTGVGRPLIRIRDLRSMECSAWTTEVHRNGHLIHPGDIVVGMDGEFRNYIWLGSPAWLNQRVCHFQPLPGVPRGYVFCALEPELDFLERSKTGTTVIHLGKGDIDGLQFVWPGAAVLRDFGNLVEPLLDRVVVAAAEAQTLKHIRDALLPKLVSGELRAPEAEQLVSEAV